MLALSGQRSVIRSSALEHLQTLAARLDDYVLTADESGRERTRALVDSVIAAIAEDNSLTDELRVHLRQMADQLAWSLDTYDITGDFELNNAIDRLLITIGVTAKESDDGGMWTKIVNTFVSPFVVGTTAELTGSAILMLVGGAG